MSTPPDNLQPPSKKWIVWNSIHLTVNVAVASLYAYRVFVYHKRGYVLFGMVTWMFCVLITAVALWVSIWAYRTRKETIAQIDTLQKLLRGERPPDAPAERGEVNGVLD